MNLSQSDSPRSHGFRNAGISVWAVGHPISRQISKKCDLMHWILEKAGARPKMSAKEEQWTPRKRRSSSSSFRNSGSDRTICAHKSLSRFFIFNMNRPVCFARRVYAWGTVRREQRLYRDWLRTMILLRIRVTYASRRKKKRVKDFKPNFRRDFQRANIVGCTYTHTRIALPYVTITIALFLENFW